MFKVIAFMLNFLILLVDDEVEEFTSKVIIFS
jgi:hypothetical protein